MRELRRDFRAVYGISYDDTPTDEAIDLALSLGFGTHYGASRNPDMAWGYAQYQCADIIDLLAVINWRLAKCPKEFTPNPVPRPGDAKRHQVKQDKAASVADILKNTKWRDIE